ncbi:MAG TPA: XdhC family protein [Longimicrobiales bacterium]|nr:XdhC family protein [Longimicrobiales bacterium]
MTDALTAVDEARAVVAVADGAPAVAVVAAIEPGGPVRRVLVDGSGGIQGALGDARLDDAAVCIAHRLLGGPDEGPALETVELEGRSWLLYAEAYRPPEHLVIVGAGHIAVPLAGLGVLLDFRVTVLDDREEFTGPGRFPDSASVLRTDFATDPFGGVRLDDRSYVVLVTRGHRWDFDCLRRLVAAEARPRYIGMIGSRRRVRAAFHALLEAGTARDLLAGIHAPVGLEIGAETPGEIAVSIAAELVAVRRSAVAGSLASREQVLERLLKEP